MSSCVCPAMRVGRSTSSNVLVPLVAVLMLSAVLTAQLGMGLNSSNTMPSVAAAPSLNQRLLQMERGLRGAVASAQPAVQAGALAAFGTATVRAATMAAAMAPPPPGISPAATSFNASYLVAAHEPLRDAPTALRLLKSMLGLGRLLRRTVVLPATLCTCVFGAAAAKLLQVSECASGVAATPRDIPFGCPLRPEVRSALALEHWVQGSLPRTPLHLSSPLAPVSLLAASALPRDLARSHVRVLLPDGMSDSETRYALRSYGDTRILELERTAEAYCGWDPRHDQSGEGAQFEELVRPLFAASTPTLHICEHFHGGAGEVQRFTNLGTLGDTHAVSAPFASLPASVRNLPNGSDLVITFATGSVSTMALNWARAAVRAGVSDILIGALDVGMMEACERAGTPCVLIRGGAISAELVQRPVLQPTLTPVALSEDVGAQGGLLPRAALVRLQCLGV